MDKKAFAATLLIILSVCSVVLPFSSVIGQLGVNVYTVTPTEGVAGVDVNVQGTINTPNGPYQVYVGGKLVASNNSEGYYVNANFTAPELPGGAYTLTLRDVDQRINATGAFTILTGYNIHALAPTPPAQFQEGDDVVLNVTLTGAKPNTSYYANITVNLPDPLSTEYWQVIALTPSTQTGTASSQVTFLGTAFQPSGAVTNFTGFYKIYFNKTESLASDQFFVGFTNAAQYHRDQTVSIRAVGYQPSQSATIKITNQQSSETLQTQNVTASNDGVINATWTVPSNAALGVYQVAITPDGTQKGIADVESFSVPGYSTRFRTLNLAGEIVPQIQVEATDQATNITYSGTSGSDGIVSLSLEKGSHNVSAYWNDVRVAQTSVTVTEASDKDLTCTLTNLKIIVQDPSGFPIPSVSLNITYSYTTTKDGSSKTGGATGITGISGTFFLNSTLPGIDYKIDASVYGRVFNSQNNTFRNIPAVPTYTVTILFPSQNLTLTVLDYNFDAIPNARLTMGELTSGIFYVSSTNAEGLVSLEVAFGKYELKIYKDNVLLNDTIIEVFEDIQTDIRCVLYKLPVSVLVVDYFGQPIPNMNVIYRGPDGAKLSETTQADGIAKFNGVIGGNAQIIAYPTGQENNFEAVSLRVDSPIAVQVKLGRFILLGGFLMDTGMFATVIIISVVVILLLVLEVVRRKRSKPAKTQVNANAGLK